MFFPQVPCRLPAPVSLTLGVVSVKVVWAPVSASVPGRLTPAYFDFKRRLNTSSSATSYIYGARARLHLSLGVQDVRLKLSIFVYLSCGSTDLASI